MRPNLRQIERTFSLLVDALAIRRFQEGKLEESRRYLEEQGRLHHSRDYPEPYRSSTLQPRLNQVRQNQQLTFRVWLGSAPPGMAGIGWHLADFRKIGVSGRAVAAADSALRATIRKFLRDRKLVTYLDARLERRNRRNLRRRQRMIAVAASDSAVLRFGPNALVSVSG